MDREIWFLCIVIRAMEAGIIESYILNQLELWTEMFWRALESEISTIISHIYFSLLKHLLRTIIKDPVDNCGPFHHSP